MTDTIITTNGHSAAAPATAPLAQPTPQPTPPAVEFDDRELDFLDLLIAIAKHKRMILAVTLGSAVVAAIVSLLLPNRYTATTQIMPPQQTQSTASMVLSQLGSAGGAMASLAGEGLGLKSPNDIYIGMLKSRTVADALIAQYDLRRIYRDRRMFDARKDLAGYSDIVSEKEGLISISVEDKDPKRAAAIANSYVTELRKLTQTLAVTEASQRRLFFEEQLQRAKDDLATSEVALKNTQQKTGMIQLDSQAKALIEQIGMLRAQIATKEVELQAMRSFATEQNPDYVVLQQEVAGLRTQLSKTENQQSDKTGDPLLATSEMPGVAMDYVRRLREVKYREAVFDLLAKQFEAAKVDEAKQAAVIQVLDKAVEPDKRSGPMRVVIIILSVTAAFFIVLGLVMIQQALLWAEEQPMHSYRMAMLRRFVLGAKPAERE